MQKRYFCCHYMITMLKFSYFIYIFLLYHSNGTKSTPKKRKHEEGNEDAVTKKSKIVRTKRGTDVRINTYMYSVVVVFIYKFFTFSPLSLLTLFFVSVLQPPPMNVYYKCKALECSRTLHLECWEALKNNSEWNVVTGDCMHDSKDGYSVIKDQTQLTNPHHDLTCGECGKQHEQDA